MSDTPRTNAVWADTGQNILEHARTLERELNAAERIRKGLEQLHHECGIDLPDEGLSTETLVANLLTAAHDIDTRNLAALGQRLALALRALDVLRRDSKSPDFVKVYCALMEECVSEIPKGEASASEGRKYNAASERQEPRQ